MRDLRGLKTDRLSFSRRCGCTASERMLESRDDRRAINLAQAITPEFSGQMGRAAAPLSASVLRDASGLPSVAQSLTVSRPGEAPEASSLSTEPPPAAPALNPVPTPPMVDLSGLDLSWTVLDRPDVPPVLEVVALHLSELTMAVARLKAIIEAMEVIANDDGSC